MYKFNFHQENRCQFTKIYFHPKFYIYWVTDIYVKYLKKVRDTIKNSRRYVQILGDIYTNEILKIIIDIFNCTYE